MNDQTKTRKGIRSFSGLFWLVILFEFFERGSYYGVMSVLSVYLTDILNISKENVGLIKGTIQPILYFLPIISGALADRFGYRRTLLAAFTLLGGGYFLTSRMTTYSTVFLALCLMALGAGTFKPIISGSIARTTDEKNSTIGFGIYYWSINLGAFLFPLFLVPYLKTVPSTPPWNWVLIAAALGTGLMIVPTILFYKEPTKSKKDTKEKEFNLVRTLANSFEIIYSPFILLYNLCRKSRERSVILLVISILGVGFTFWLFHVKKSFFSFYLILLFVISQFFLWFQPHFNGMLKTLKLCLSLIFAISLGMIFFLMPGLSLYSRIVSSIISMTLLSLLLIEFNDIPKYKDHFHFLLMIFIYSGFWVLYFQMFDSVLWYVKDYVDASSLNNFINNLLKNIGLNINWFFDVEHVTVINAGTIILLQLFVSMIVRKAKAMPTMMVGITLGTLGMAILAINTNIWVFIVGIIIFSIGEMTAHPKFISYVGQTAPKHRVATYMGYIFLYGVIGSSIGAPLGAKLYVHFVDNLNQPRTLWLIFSGIGVFTLVALSLFNKFVKSK